MGQPLRSFLYVGNMFCLRLVCVECEVLHLAVLDQMADDVPGERDVLDAAGLCT